LLLNLNGTIVPWVLGTLIILVLLSTVNVIKAWRDLKRSPYFFLRRQAEKRLQNYSLSSFGFILVALFVGTYAWQAPQDTTFRSVLLNNDKPPKTEVSDAVAAVAKAAEAELMAEEAQLDLPAASIRFANPTEVVSTTDAVAAEEVGLPSEFDQLEPSADLNINTNLSPLLFSTEVTSDYEAINPGRIFPEGFFTIYATFAYEEMTDGMEWAWVWRHNGKVVSGGNELWNYGDDGPGYVYLNPEEGFQAGEYKVEVWVNSELLTSSTLVINNAAISAGN
jgi:hypothetical protein